jgi:ribonuclease HI
VTLGQVAERLNALSALASLNEVTLVGVQGHCGIPGNEKADKLARQASDMSLLGPELALGIPRYSQREEIKNWTDH